MPNVEKVYCERCDGYGKHRKNPLAPWNDCKDCDGTGTIEQSSIVAATVKKDLMVEPVSNRYKLDFDDLEQWALDGCPEGVSGKVQDVFALIEVARQLRADDLVKRMSDAVTLLYTHGVLTDKMRAHCRRELS